MSLSERMAKDSNTCCKCIPIKTGIILIALFHAIIALFFIIDIFIIHKDILEHCRNILVFGIRFNELKPTYYVLIITEAIISLLLIGVRFEKNSKIFYQCYVFMLILTGAMWGIGACLFFRLVTIDSSLVPPICKPFMITMCIGFCIGAISRIILLNKVAKSKSGTSRGKAMGVVINDDKIDGAETVTTPVAVTIE